MAAVHHLGFLKIQIFSVAIMCITVPNFIKISQDVAEITIFWFSRWRPSTIFDCRAHFGTTQYPRFHEEQLEPLLSPCKVWYRITTVVLIIRLHVWLENAYSRRFLGIFGMKIGENRNFLHLYFSRNAITRNWHRMNETALNRFCDLVSGCEQNLGSQKKKKNTREWYFTYTPPLGRLLWIWACGVISVQEFWSSDTAKSVILHTICWSLLNSVLHQCTTVLHCDSSHPCRGRSKTTKNSLTNASATRSAASMERSADVRLLIASFACCLTAAVFQLNDKAFPLVCMQLAMLSIIVLVSWTFISAC